MELNIEYQLLQQTTQATHKQTNTHTHTHINYCSHIKILPKKQTLKRKYKLMTHTT